MKLIKFIVRNMFKLIDFMIDFINDITGLNISNLPRFPKELDKEKMNMDIYVPLEGPAAEEIFRMIKNRLEVENKTH